MGAPRRIGDTGNPSGGTGCLPPCGERLCIGCHQYYNTPGWEKIIGQYGRAETAEQHERMVSEAIKMFMDNTE